MKNEVTAERITMYKVTPSWGTKNLKVVAVKLLKRGKTVYMPFRNTKRKWMSISRMYATPKAAVKARIKAVIAEKKDQAKWDRKSANELNEVKALLKSL